MITQLSVVLGPDKAKAPVGRSLLIGAAVLATVLAYVGSYFCFSRRGMAEAEDVGLDGFLYVPFDAAAATEDLTRQHALAKLYAPLNWFDRQLMDSDVPVT